MFSLINFDWKNVQNLTLELGSLDRWQVIPKLTEFWVPKRSPGHIACTVNHEIFAPLKVGEFAFFQLAVDKILHLLQNFNG
jgi:hypothetical protein